MFETLFRSPSGKQGCSSDIHPFRRCCKNSHSCNMRVSAWQDTIALRSINLLKATRPLRPLPGEERGVGKISYLDLTMFTRNIIPEVQHNCNRFVTLVSLIMNRGTRQLFIYKQLSRRSLCCQKEFFRKNSIKFWRK